MSFLLGVGLFSEALAVISRAIMKQIKHDRRTGWPQEKTDWSFNCEVFKHHVWLFVFIVCTALPVHKSWWNLADNNCWSVGSTPAGPQDAVFFGWGYWELKISCRHGGDDCILSSLSTVDPKWYASPKKKTTLSFAIIGLSFWELLLDFRLHHDGSPYLVNYPI